jgi:predicted ester cyclase
MLQCKISRWVALHSGTSALIVLMGIHGMSTASNIPFFLDCTDHFGVPERRELYLRLYDPSIVLHGYGLSPGLDSVRTYYQALWTGFPDVVLRMDDVFEAGDKLVSRFACSGTHLGEFRGVAPTGLRVEWPGITILRFAAGRCVERWSQTDRLSMLQQIRAIGAPSASS